MSNWLACLRFRQLTQRLSRMKGGEERNAELVCELVASHKRGISERRREAQRKRETRPLVTKGQRKAEGEKGRKRKQLVVWITWVRISHRLALRFQDAGQSASASASASAPCVNQPIWSDSVNPIQSYPIRVNKMKTNQYDSIQSDSAIDPFRSGQYDPIPSNTIPANEIQSDAILTDPIQ